MPPDPSIARFEAQRPRLVRLAYRMLGSTLEAEDIVQEAWIRWQCADRSAVQVPEAWLSRTVTRLCLDAMSSARARRETYWGPWLPEPIAEPAEEGMRLDELTLTLMLALERLSPLERAAFLLHDVFDMPLDEIAGALQRDGAAVRQLAVRARRHLRDARPRYRVPREESERLARAFFAASTSGDTASLRSLLAQDVAVTSDGGGKVIAFRNPIAGRERVLRLYAGLSRKHDGRPPDLLRTAWIDGLPGYISRERGNILQTTALDIVEGRIASVYVTRNPDKLAGIARLIGMAPPGGPRH